MCGFPKRKPNRLKDYDYSQNGAYFVTVCTKNREEILSTVGANCVRPLLTQIGNVIETQIMKMQNIYPQISVTEYVIMPNHIHFIICIGRGMDGINRRAGGCHGRTDGINGRMDEINGRTQFAPTLSRLLKQWKGVTTKQIGFSPWQKSFHDHIIRDEADYIRIAQYIRDNPLNWNKDCFYNAIEKEG